MTDLASASGLGERRCGRNTEFASGTEMLNLRQARAAKLHVTSVDSGPEDENSLAKPTKIIPSAGTFAAGSNFTYRFPAYSITVLRIGLTTYLRDRKARRHRGNDCLD